MERKYIEKFYKKDADIGIPDFKNKNRLFLHSGKIIELTDEMLILKQKNGYRQILLDKIVEIKEGTK